MLDLQQMCNRCELRLVCTKLSNYNEGFGASHMMLIGFGTLTSLRTTEPEVFGIIFSFNLTNGGIRRKLTNEK